MHGLGCEAQLIAVKSLAVLKKWSRKSTFAFRVGVARHKADNVTLLLNGELHKFPIAQKAVHAGIIRAGRGRTLRILFSLSASRC